MRWWLYKRLRLVLEKMRKKLEKIAFFISAPLSILGFYWAYSIGVLSVFTNPIFRLPEEIVLERKIGKPIHMGKMYYGKSRQNKIKLFAKEYYKSKKHWDNFDKQFNLINHLVIERCGGLLTELTKHLGGEAYGTNLINLQKINDEYLIHELAHVWHEHIRSREFNSKWKETSEDYYFKNNKCLSLQDVKNLAAKNGAVSYYGLTNLNEDVAETARFVYKINNPYYKASNKNKNLNYQKIAKKINLLKEFDFISDKECGKAIKKLDDIIK